MWDGVVKRGRGVEGQKAREREEKTEGAQAGKKTTAAIIDNCDPIRKTATALLLAPSPAARTASGV